MIKMKTILHPTDFSVSSNYALGYAIAFAKEFEAKLCILHVVEEVSTAFYFDASQGRRRPMQIMMDIEKHVQQERWRRSSRRRFEARSRTST